MPIGRELNACQTIVAKWRSLQDPHPENDFRHPRACLSALVSGAAARIMRVRSTAAAEIRMNLSNFYRYFFYAIWLVMIVFWLVLARNVKSTVRRQAALPRLMNLALLYAAAGLLADPFTPMSWLAMPFLPSSHWRIWCALGAIMTLMGVLLTIWARLHIGRNWSSVAAVKADHELVTTGPYQWVRHPIYSGLTLGFVGTAVAIGQWRGVLAVALALIAIAQRIVIEERFMREQFGNAYDTYARRVQALLPGLI